MTGGACGSIVAQMFRLTSAERKTLLVAGAAAGMSATFATPVSSVLLAMELLLFELKPRSIVPVALASGTAALLRQFLLGQGPIFPAAIHAFFVSPWTLVCCGLFGAVAGLVAIPLSNSVYAFEDLFRRLPIHWMWWPPIGGLALELGGLFFPQALGVGYDVIGQLVQGDRALHLLLGILIVKWLVWSISLGSGTSGGVFAPVMMIGGALGSLLSFGLPHVGPGFWAVLGLGATMCAALRVPVTAIVLTVEVTHDWNMLLPLLIGCTVSYAVSVLYLRRSILTRKVTRRGYPLSAEYEVDPLDLLYVHEVMLSTFASLLSGGSLSDATFPLRTAYERSQKLLPVLNAEGILQGIVRRSDLTQHQDETERNVPLAEILQSVKARAYPDEALEAVVDRMAEKEVTSMPVVDPQSDKVLGVISLKDLLKARAHHLEEERGRQQCLRWRPFSFPRTRKLDPAK